MIKKIIIFMMLNVSVFALRINDTDLDLKLKLGKKDEKIFVLKNDNNYTLRYKLSLENNTKEVKVTPNIILIPAFSQKEFKVSVFGSKKGEKKYKLILEEEALNLESNGSSAKVKMKYRIDQKYIVE